MSTDITPQFSSITLPLDLAADGLQSVSLTGNITFSTANLAPGRSKKIRIIADGTQRTFTFPGAWTFVGSAVPANIAAGKTAILELTTFGTTDADVIARYTVQS
jgi:hypothetical protein